uniref:Uncharacterized protein n=1 Tax=Geospiza parvula TaxID=87175 RepID=A0A8C3MM14_GEOPR
GKLPFIQFIIFCLLPGPPHQHEQINETFAVCRALQGLKNLFLLSNFSEKRIVLLRPLAQHCTEHPFFSGRSMIH